MKKIFITACALCFTITASVFADTTTFNGTSEGYSGVNPQNQAAYDYAIAKEKELANKYGMTIPGVTEQQSFTVPVTTTNYTIYESPDIKIYVNGQLCSTDVPPITINNNILVPIRFISDNLNANISWDATDQTISISKGALISIGLKINSKDMFVNYNKKNLSIEPVLYHDRTFVPVRAIGEAFLTNVEWDDSERAIYINNILPDECFESVPTKPIILEDKIILTNDEECYVYAFDPTYNPRNINVFIGSNKVIDGKYRKTDNPMCTEIYIKASHTKTGTSYLKICFEDESLASDVDNVHTLTVKVVKENSKEYERELLRREQNGE